TLTWNLNGKYTALWVKLKVEPGRNVFLQGLDEIELPVAHAEGRIVPREPAVLDDWEQRGQVVLRYTWRTAARRPAFAGAAFVGAVAGSATSESTGRAPAAIEEAGLLSANAPRRFQQEEARHLDVRTESADAREL